MSVSQVTRGTPRRREGGLRLPHAGQPEPEEPDPVAAGALTRRSPWRDYTLRPRRPVGERRTAMRIQQPRPRGLPAGVLARPARGGRVPEGPGRMVAGHGRARLPGGGGRRLGPEGPRAGLHPRRERHLPPLVYGVQTTTARRQVPGHATSPDGLRWTRDRANPLFTESWVEMSASSAATAGTSCSPREGRRRAPDDLARRPALDRPRPARRPPGRRHPDHPPAPTARLPPGRGRHLVPFLRALPTGASGWRPRRTGASGPTCADSPSSTAAPALRTARPWHQPGHQADGVYYAFYHRLGARPWKDWSHQHRALPRPGPLGEVPANPIVRNNCSSANPRQGPQGDRLYTMPSGSAGVREPKIRCCKELGFSSFVRGKRAPRKSTLRRVGDRDARSIKATRKWMPPLD